MKPNTKSKYFYLSIVACVAYFVHLFVLRSMVIHVLTIKSANGDTLPALLYMPFLWISLAGWFYYKSTKANQAMSRQTLAFVVTPIVLAPVLGLLYVLIVLTPIYSLAGQI